MKSRDGVSRVILTFDDGPEPGTTEQILEVLRSAGLRATFFVIGTRARLYPELVADVISEGHEVGLHGSDHRNPLSIDNGVFARDLVSAKHEMEDHIGRFVRWFRPPYGAQSTSTWISTLQAELLPVVWRATFRDWRALSMEDRVKAATYAVAPGSVVLAHDGFADGRDRVDDGPRPEFSRKELLLTVLSAYEEVGLIPSSLSEASAAGDLETITWLTPDQFY